MNGFPARSSRDPGPPGSFATARERIAAVRHLHPMLSRSEGSWHDLGN